MRPESKAKIRDRRKPGWFRIDDELIEVYGPEIGVHGIAVYAALCKHANKDESSYPGLRLLCEKLKIGRKKLLDTLSQLQELGLIDIEPGDRVSVNVYTLLDVPKQKGGSNENHVPPEGGSNENQGGSEQHQGGGSNENHNQTHREPNPFNQRDVEAHDTPIPDDTTTKCLLSLKKVNGVGKNYGELAVLLGELREEFPEVSPVAVCKEYELYHRKPPKPTRNHALKLRTFFKNADKWRDKSQPAAPKPAGKDYAWLEKKMREG